jgi:hypothetical protein
MSDTVKSAIIGALSALIVTLVKDVIIDQIRRSRESRKALIDRRLTELYSPLWVALGGGANSLGQILSDDFVYGKLVTNFHLLSKRLRELIEQFLKLGTGDVRGPRLGLNEMKTSIELQKEIVSVLASEMRDLRAEYYRF